MAEQLDASVYLTAIDPKHDTIRADNLLNEKRTGLVRAGRWLYAIGGAATDSWDPGTKGAVTALKTVERARILGYETMPNLSLPTAAPATVGLPRGAWYRVSAVTAEGESLPSREVAALNVGGKITLTWLPVTGATSYLIYRGLAADGRAGTTRLIKAGVTGTTFTDDGQGALAPAPGSLAGKLAAGGSLAVGTWTYRVTASAGAERDPGGLRHVDRHLGRPVDGEPIRFRLVRGRGRVSVVPTRVTRAQTSGQIRLAGLAAREGE
jgi:hypothetical protein